jgi:cystathionine gamma-synthase
MSITLSVVSRQPPGGRCTLYMHLTDIVAEVAGGRSELLYPQPRFPHPERPVPPAPALLINGEPVPPGDGVLLTPEEICAAVVAAGFEGDAGRLLEKLEAELERMMEALENS